MIGLVLLLLLLVHLHLLEVELLLLQPLLLLRCQLLLRRQLLTHLLLELLRLLQDLKINYTSITLFLADYFVFVLRSLKNLGAGLIVGRKFHPGFSQLGGHITRTVKNLHLKVGCTYDWPIK